MDMPVSVGVEHRKAPERLPDAAETPWELRVSRRPAGLHVGERPWDAGPTRHGVCVTAFARTPRAQACEGTSQGESSGDGGKMTCSEGGSEALEPRPWNQGGEGSSVRESSELSTSYSSEFEVALHRG